MFTMCLAVKCYTVCSLDIYVILMACHCYAMFYLALVLILTFGYLSFGLRLELLSLESKPVIRYTIIGLHNKLSCAKYYS